MKSVKPYLAGLGLALPLLAGAGFSHAQTSPLAEGHDKFLGSIYSPSQLDGFTDYFNQVVSENAGKWGVIGNRSTSPLYSAADYQDAWFTAVGDGQSWHGGLDESFEFAKDNNLPYRMHVLLWGNQQPTWIHDLPANDQLLAIEAWFDAVAARYNGQDGGFDFIEVVNEPVNDPPRAINDEDTDSGNYIDALGGEGETGWDWVITAFEMARDRFPDTPLMINEYSVLSSTNVLNRYIDLIETLVDEGLLDGVGIQGHAFSTIIDSELMISRLDQVAEAAGGLPIYITEMDIDGETDMIQLQEYRRIFPIFWEHEAVDGVTLWGFRPGLWRDEQAAYLVHEDGTERPAMQWLRCYLDGLLESGHPGVAPDQSLSIAGRNEGAYAQAYDCYGDISSQTDNWSIAGGDGANLFTIDNQGRVSLIANADVDINVEYTLELVAHTGDDASEPQAVSVVVIDWVEVRPDPSLPKGSSGGHSGGLILLLLAVLGGLRLRKSS